MKTFASVVLWLGLIVMGISMAVMFGALEKYINTDRAWLSCLFGGLIITCTGFLLDSLAIQPQNMHQVSNKKKLIINMVFAISGSTILLIMSQFVKS